MSGYCGFSMSNNAVDAYANGEKPLSKWTKSAILDEIFHAVENGEITLHCDNPLLKKVPANFLKSACLVRSSWHHTSSHYNKTDFYTVNLDAVEHLTNEALLEAIQSKSAPVESKPDPERWKCAFLEWSGTRKHPKATEIIEVGTIEGNWFIRSDGSKKKTTANGFRFIEKVQ
jgi:hypothetical protein